MRKLATLLSLFAVLAIAVPVTAQARHGADDPVGHVRHGRGADDRQAQKSTGTHKAKKATAATTAKADGRGRGADDAPGDDRGGHGADDGPNHS